MVSPNPINVLLIHSPPVSAHHTQRSARLFCIYREEENKQTCIIHNFSFPVRSKFDKGEKNNNTKTLILPFSEY